MERLRRTMMFVPGNNPAMIKDAGIYGADSIMFDLEDSVSLNEKDTARMLVFEALQNVDYGNSELVVRINGLDTEMGRADIFAMVKAGVKLFVCLRQKLLMMLLKRKRLSLKLKNSLALKMVVHI
jgi:Citrate lyase beta subunit